MNDYRDNMDNLEVFEPTVTPTTIVTTQYPHERKKSGFARKLLLTMLAVAVGGIFLGLGLSVGYIAMQHFVETRAEEPTLIAQEPAVYTIAHERQVITIDSQTPDFTEIIAQVKDSVVSIQVTTALRGGGFLPPSEHHGAGSGFIFAMDDEYVFIATNHHVVANTSAITVSLDDNERVPANMIGSEPDYDLAVLAVSLEVLEEKGVPFSIAALGCSDRMRMGDSVVAIGNAMGAGQTVTKGIISAVNLQITVQDQSARTSLTLDVMQTDAAVNQGNSGGPLVNQYGEVIGIVTAKLFGHGIEGMGYVLPTNNIYDFLMEIKELGTERHAWLGIHSEEVNENIRSMFNLPSTGLLIRMVVEDSPAYHAGFQEWDLLVSFDGHPVANHPELLAAMSLRRPGDEASVGVYRNGELIEISIVLGSRPLT